jgi:ribonuclease HII
MLALADGWEIPQLGLPCQGIVRGDARSLSIACASIVAKVWRDSLMRRLGERFPGYGFGKHVGYGTPAHLEAIDRLGPCAIHRRSFAPVAQTRIPTTA